MIHTTLFDGNYCGDKYKGLRHYSDIEAYIAQTNRFFSNEKWNALHDLKEDHEAKVTYILSKCREHFVC